jgi:hypothetical protein
MSVAEDIIEKLSTLPLGKQLKVLRYIETLESAPHRAAKKNIGSDSHPWIKVGLSMSLDGPPNWLEKIDDYLNADLLERKFGKRLHWGSPGGLFCL